MLPPLCPLTVAAVPVLGAVLPLAPAPLRVNSRPPPPAPHLQPEDVSETCRSGGLGRNGAAGGWGGHAP